MHWSILIVFVFVIGFCFRYWFCLFFFIAYIFFYFLVQAKTFGVYDFDDPNVRSFETCRAVLYAYKTDGPQLFWIVMSSMVTALGVALLADMPCWVAWELRHSTPLPGVSDLKSLGKRRSIETSIPQWDSYFEMISVCFLFLLFINIFRKCQFQGTHLFVLHSLIFLFLSVLLFCFNCLLLIFSLFWQRFFEAVKSRDIKESRLFGAKKCILHRHQQPLYWAFRKDNSFKPIQYL